MPLGNYRKVYPDEDEEEEIECQETEEEDDEEEDDEEDEEEDEETVFKSNKQKSMIRISKVEESEEEDSEYEYAYIEAIAIEKDKEEIKQEITTTDRNNQLRDLIFCPISKQIMRNPVLAADGHFYERNEITRWFKTKKSSPLTRKYIKTVVQTSIPLKIFIDDYLKDKPELEKQRYIEIKPHSQYREEVKTLMNRENFSELLNYSEFRLSFFSDKIFEYFFKTCQDEKVMIHFIDNILDANYKFFCGWYIVHYISRYSTTNVLKHFIETSEKEILLKETTKSNKTIFLHLGLYHDLSLIPLLENKGINISENKYNDHLITGVFYGRSKDNILSFHELYIKNKKLEMKKNLLGKLFENENLNIEDCFQIIDLLKDFIKV